MRAVGAARRMASEPGCGRDQRGAGTVRAAAATDDNLVPIIMDAVRADGTLGEICATLKGVFGTYREPEYLEQFGKYSTNLSNSALLSGHDISSLLDAQIGGRYENTWQAEHIAFSRASRARLRCW
jgi:hypothetical protein